MGAGAAVVDRAFCGAAFLPSALGSRVGGGGVAGHSAGGSVDVGSGSSSLSSSRRGVGTSGHSGTELAGEQIDFLGSPPPKIVPAVAHVDNGRGTSLTATATVEPDIATAGVS
jgi:hypothetical protein